MFKFEIFNIFSQLYRLLFLMVIILIPYCASGLDNKTKFGIEYPVNEVFINDNEHTRITVNCFENDDRSGNISCAFNFVSVSNISDQLDKKNLTELSALTENELGKEIDKLSKEFCSKDAIKYFKSSKSDNIINFYECLKPFCEVPSRASLIQFYEYMNKEDEQICEIYTDTYHEDFTYVSAANRWVHQSEPKGQCGVISISYLERDSQEGYSNFSWNYYTKSVLTNKNKETILFGKCDEFIDSSDHFYPGKWSSLRTQQDKLALMGCKYIRLD